MKKNRTWKDMGTDSEAKIKYDRDWIVRDLVKKGLSEEKVLDVFANWLKPEIKKLYRKHKRPNNV
tara:strand:- start:870 stop:1064 length:195 start_codon:yes stop_codon:yes gene_type:complete